MKQEQIQSNSQLPGHSPGPSVDLDELMLADELTLDEATTVQVWKALLCEHHENRVECIKTLLEKGLNSYVTLNGPTAAHGARIKLDNVVWPSPLIIASTLPDLKERYSIIKLLSQKRELCIMTYTQGDSPLGSSVAASFDFGRVDREAGFWKEISWTIHLIDALDPRILMGARSQDEHVQGELTEQEKNWSAEVELNYERSPDDVTSDFHRMLASARGIPGYDPNNYLSPYDRNTYILVHGDESDTDKVKQLLEKYPIFADTYLRDAIITNRSVSTIALFLHFGANPAKKESDGLTVLEFAKIWAPERTSLIKLLSLASKRFKLVKAATLFSIATLGLAATSGVAAAAAGLFFPISLPLTIALGVAASLLFTATAVITAVVAKYDTGLAIPYRLINRITGTYLKVHKLFAPLTNKTPSSHAKIGKSAPPQAAESVEYDQNTPQQPSQPPTPGISRQEESKLGVTSSVAPKGQ